MNHLVDSFSPVQPVRSHKSLGTKYSTQWLRDTPQNFTSSISPQSTNIASLSVNKTRPISQITQSSVSLLNSPPIPYAKLIRPHSVPNTEGSKRYYSKKEHFRTSSVDILARKRPFLKRVTRKLQIPLVIFISIAAGEAMQTLVLGEFLICAYAVYALARHVSSHLTFQLTFIALIGILVLILLDKDAQLASNFAVYSFLLLAVGMVSLILENHRSSRI